MIRLLFTLILVTILVLSGASPVFAQGSPAQPACDNVSRLARDNAAVDFDGSCFVPPGLA